MANLNKHVVRKMEEQYLKDVKHFFLRIQNLNVQLHSLLLQIAKKAETDEYSTLIDYINQYITHTDLWSLRFTNNLQNIEVAVLQVILLERIFQDHHDIPNIVEHEVLAECKDILFSLNDHVPKLFEIHQDKIKQFSSSNS